MTIFRSDDLWRFAGLAGVLVAGVSQPALAAIDVPVPVPSRQAVTLEEVVTNVPGVGLTYRFRYLAPHIRAGADYDVTVEDMQYLCDAHALPRLSALGPTPHQIVISLADQPVAFGEISPDAVQFFEAYRPADDHCEWEGF